MPLSPHTKLGPYEIISRLGAGGMGEVYRARDTRLNREVAIKVLPASFAGAADRLRRFEVEARATSALNHPNILTIHDFGTHDGAPYIVAELLEGRDLREELKQGAIPLSKAVDYARQIVSGLMAAHAKGIIHRDLKPENLFVTADGRVKILDFGLAKIIDQAGPPLMTTDPGVLMGTFTYMSPEQARGETADMRADIFSLGIVFYEMLEGRNPFEGRTASEVMVAILMTEPLPLSRHSSEAPPDLGWIIGRMLIKDRERRYQTTAEIHRDLENLKQEIDFKAQLKRFRLPNETEELVDTFITDSLPPEAFVTTSSNQLGNLSNPPTPLIGRETEITAIKQLLRQEEVRMLTLTGIGGTGKTSLALQVASDLIAEFADGVWLVSLASINDSGLVASAIAQTLGLKESADLPLIDSLKEYLRAKRILLLLDNFEQIVAAGPLIAELLSACPRLKTLVTSRATLRLRWEHEFPVPPLATPDLDQTAPEMLIQSPAVDLFIQRARAVRPGFALTPENARAVAEICARLDGLPLAIELAAARIKALTPQAIRQRLDRRLQLLTGGARDLPARQQTIRNMITWSYDLLEESEKILFRRLAVFVGGCTLEAAEDVCNRRGESDLDVLDNIASLLDKSLLRQKEQSDSEMRYTMLETIKEYGLEQLESSGEAETVRRHHAEFFLKLAEEAEPELTGANQQSWLDRLELEHDNLRAVLRQMAKNGDAKTGIVLAGTLWRFWLMRSHLSEGREWLAGMLAPTDG
jgi:predicted ATPase